MPDSKPEYSEDRKGPGAAVGDLRELRRGPLRLRRLDFAGGSLSECPLGSGALAGVNYLTDRFLSAELLGFTAPTPNSMDSVADRDYLIELLSALSTIAMHLSRFCEEIIIWNTNEYRFVEIDDSYSTGSSIMPQKKNPDIAELIRGKSGRVFGHLMGLGFGPGAPGEQRGRQAEPQPFRQPFHSPALTPARHRTHIFSIHDSPLFLRPGIPCP